MILLCLTIDKFCCDIELRTGCKIIILLTPFVILTMAVGGIFSLEFSRHARGNIKYIWMFLGGTMSLQSVIALIGLALLWKILRSNKDYFLIWKILDAAFLLLGLIDVWCIFLLELYYLLSLVLLLLLKLYFWITVYSFELQLKAASQSDRKTSSTEKPGPSSRRGSSSDALFNLEDD